MTVPAIAHLNISAVELGFETSMLKYQNSFRSEILLKVTVHYGCYNNEKIMIFMLINKCCVYDARVFKRKPNV